MCGENCGKQPQMMQQPQQQPQAQPALPAQPEATNKPMMAALPGFGCGGGCGGCGGCGTCGFGAPFAGSVANTLGMWGANAGMLGAPFFYGGPFFGSCGSCGGCGPCGLNTVNPMPFAGPMMW